MESLHFIAMSGDRGCLPDYCHAFLNRKDAVESLIELLELRPHGNFAEDLRKFGYTDLQKDNFGIKVMGAEYAEIQKCSCSDFSSHNED
jgi:hypothetical protein